MKQSRLGTKKGKLDLHCRAFNFLEPITKLVEDTKQNLLEESKATAKASDDSSQKFS